MKRFFFILLAIVVGGVGSAWADDNVQAAQIRLKAEGFYFGAASGNYNSATAAAVTRYQIRHGLAISGKLDEATAKALGLATTNTPATQPSPTSDAWRQLRNEDAQFLKALNSGAIPPPRDTSDSTPTPAPTAVASPPPPVPPTPEPKMVGAPPKRAREKRSAPAERLSSRGPDATRERLRDYVGAFVLAGLDPKVGAELEFFGPRVNYFGERNLDQARIKRDLLRYDARWPERRFWLAGDLMIERKPGGGVTVTFPLRYELRRGSRQASGKVMKTLTLRKAGADDFEIVAVNERKVSTPSNRSRS